MYRIFKFPIKLDPRQIIMLPQGSRILSAQIQKRQLVLWTIFDTKAIEVRRGINIVLNGPEFEGNPGVHIATLQGGDDIVLHIFDGGELPPQFDQ